MRMSTWPGFFFSLLLPWAVYAQSSSLLDALRLQQPHAIQLAHQELDSCQKTSCPQLATLQLLMGTTYLSQEEAPKTLTPSPKTAPAPPPSPGATRALEYLQGASSSPGLPPPLLPFSLWYLAQAHAYAGEIPAALLLLQKMDNAPAWLLSKTKLRMAELQFLHGQYASSLKILAAEPSQNPEALFLLALNYLRMQQQDKALSPLGQLAVRFPTHPHGVWAQETLEELPMSRLPAFRRKPAERLLRAKNLVEGGASQKALEELGRLPQKLEPAQKAEAAFWRARAYFTQGKPELAQPQIALALKGTPLLAQQAAWLVARRHIRNRENTSARQWLAKAANKGAPKLADEARFMSAWLWLNEGQWEKAQTALKKFADEYPHSSFAVDARWFQGWAQFRQGHCDKASQTWQTAAIQWPNSPLYPQFLYWAARCTPQTSPAEITAYESALSHLADNFPASLYGRMAKERLQKNEALFPLLPALPPSPMPQELALAQALFQAGLFADAQTEIETLRRQVRNSEAALRLGTALQNLGAYDVAYQLAARHLWGAAFSRREPLPLSLFFPRAFEAEVLSSCHGHLLPPALVWAVMRRESAFSVNALSHANARGLMQIIPPTGQRIAQQLGMTLSNSDALFAPALNISFGSWYLQKLVERFGHLAPAIAAYNAGPKAVLLWLSTHGQRPLDEWIEEIPFRETRLYVKQVLPDVYAFAEMYASLGGGGSTPSVAAAGSAAPTPPTASTPPPTAPMPSMAPLPPPPWTWALPEPQTTGVSF